MSGSPGDCDDGGNLGALFTWQLAKVQSHVSRCEFKLLQQVQLSMLFS